MTEPFHIHIRHVRYDGTYEVVGRFLHIRTAYGSKRAPIGLTEPLKLAKALLRAVLKDVARVTPPVVVAVAAAQETKSVRLQ